LTFKIGSLKGWEFLALVDGGLDEGFEGYEVVGVLNAGVAAEIARFFT
jgi:hypothetical protein